MNRHSSLPGQPVGCCMIIPAAGKGTRFGAEVPKQYLSLRGKTITEHTLEKSLSSSVIQHIAVAISPEDDIWCTLPVTRDQRISTAEGGAERSESVLNALESLQGQLADDAWVMVHDMARPCLSEQALQRLFYEVTQDIDFAGGLLAIPVNDTVKRVGANNQVKETVDRSQLWLAQTPQMFRYGELYQALKQAGKSGWQVTDEASAMELAGYKVKVVQGEVTNIKVTRPEDLVLAELYLSIDE